MSSAIVVGKVKGKPRPRFRIVAGHPQTYTTKEEREYERMIASEYRAQGGVRHEGELLVRITVRRALPKSRPKRVKSESDVFKPDADNIAKAVLDALNGVAWTDDAQVAHLEVHKMERMRIGADVMRIDVIEVGKNEADE